MREPADANMTPAGQRWVRVAQRPLDILAFVFVFALVMLWSFPGAPPAVILGLDVVLWVVWAVFVADYVVRLMLAQRRGEFVRSHKLDLMMAVLPMLRLLRVGLLLRRALRNVSTERIAGSIVCIVIAVVLVSAFLMWRVEFDAPGASITTFRIALWWAVVTTTTVGYGDYTPVTQAGRAIAMVVMVVGIGLIGTVSAAIASWFVARPADGGPLLDDERPPDHDKQTTEGGMGTDSDDRLDRIVAQQEELRAIILDLRARGDAGPGGTEHRAVVGDA